MDLEKTLKLNKMRKITLLSIMIVLTAISYSQRVCPTSLDLTLMQQQDPARYTRFMNFENFIATTIANQGGTSQRLINANGIITIPVVVHVLHDGENIGVGRNLSAAQIQSQIDVLNEDFRRLNPNRVNTPAGFLPVAADYGIEFRLACTDPNGLSTDGIIRKHSSTSNFEFTSTVGNPNLPDEGAMGIKVGESGSLPWPTDRYLNIWVCCFGDGTLGYGTFPADFAIRPNFDGIVVHTTAMGRVGNISAQFNGGRTATHEVGHWLGLRHINGDANCGNDFVADTPPQTTLNTDCPNFPLQTTCNGTTNGEMFMNYMDYTDDACMNIYTNGQRQRGRAAFALFGPRAAFLDNYFRLEPRTITLFCNGKVKLNNPNCFPVTWSVVTGPATITASNDNQATISSTASGTIRLRATGGNYITEQDFLVSQLPPHFGATYKNGITDFLNPALYNPNNPTSNVNGVCMGYAFPNNYVDGLPFGSSENSVIWSNPTPVPNSSGFSLFQQIGNRGYFNFLFNTPTVGLVQGTVVGCGSYTSTFAFTLVNCNPTGGNPCDAAKSVSYYTVSPNPATDQIRVGVGNRTAPVTCDFLKAGDTPNGITFSAVNIYNNLGTLVKSYKSTETKQASIQIGNLTAGNYLVEIITGDYVEKQQLIVQ
jgi:Pregnancy-associated plasma protein-A/Secretion system C-terminal sorting domain